MTFKKHFVSVRYVILSETCPWITLRWYKTILNQVQWTCKVKKRNKVNNFWQLHTITHQNEFRQVNNTHLKLNICSKCTMYHMPLFANSKETESLRKNGCSQKCLDKSLALWPLKNILCQSVTLFCQRLVLGLH